MVTLRQELGVPGPSPEVYALARRFATAGWEPTRPDWTTDQQLGPEARRVLMSTEGSLELSGIAAAVLAGTGQGIDHAMVLDLVGNGDNVALEPIDFDELRASPIGNLLAFQALAHGMVTTYSSRIFDRIDQLRTSADPRQRALVDRANTLLNITPEGPGTPTGNELDALFLDNLDEAAVFQAALLRIIPGLASAHMGSITQDQRSRVYQQIAQGSTQFVRDMSLIPAALSRYIGEDVIYQNHIGLWNAILTDVSPATYLDYFKLVEQDGTLRVAFSDTFTEHLAVKVIEFSSTINAVTGRPLITSENWFGCPGIHKLGGSQLNIDMWQHYVDISPRVYEPVAAQ